jgi:hypothetical protein
MHRPCLRQARALLLALGTLLLAVPTAAAGTAPPGFRPFAPDSVWNLPLRDDAPLDSHTSSYVSWLNRSVTKYGAWINTTRCGTPIFWADRTTKPVKVALASSSYQDKAMIRAWSAVPMPATAKPANCADKNFAVAQPQPNGTVREWEFWRAAKAGNGRWSARWGGAITNVRADRGIASPLSWQDPSAPAGARQSTINWYVTASSVSILAGVITVADVQRGHIDHALAFVLHDAAKGKMAWPAQRTDGGSTDTYALPEGTRLRLDPRLDLSKLAMSPLVRMIAEAAQEYGMVVRDRSYSTDTFIAEEPRPGQSDPYEPQLDDQTPGAALKSFPWSRLQVLKQTVCTGRSGCDAPQAAVISLSTSTPKVGSRLTLDTSNSTLNQPRGHVLWDLNGDGRYEAGGDAAVKKTFVPAKAGTLTVGVKITTRSGSVVTGKRTIRVAPRG